MICPEVLYEEVVEVKERVVLCDENSELKKPDCQIVTGTTGEMVRLDILIKNTQTQSLSNLVVT